MTIEFPPRPASKAELISRIRERYASLDAMLAKLPDADQTRTLVDWSVKDHLAHLAAWQGAALAAMRGVFMHEGLGLPQPPPDHRDWDAINATLHEMLVPLTLAEVRQRLHDGNAAALSEVQQASEELLAANYVDPEAAEGVTVIDVVSANTYEHYKEHETWIRDQLTEAGYALS